MSIILAYAVVGSVRERPTKLQERSHWMKRLCDNLQGCQNEEDGEVDLDDDGQVVLGEGVGQVGDHHQDGGRQEGGQQAARQRSRQVERHLEARVTVLKS